MTPLILFSSFLKSLSNIGKIVGILLIALILLVPVAFIEGLLQDRLSRRDAAIQEIDSVWGPSQQIVGPVLIVPFTYKVQVPVTKVVDGATVQAVDTQTQSDIAYFLPKKFLTDGTVTPQRRHRGIYEAIIYKTDLHFTGTFAPIDLSAFHIPNAEVSWNDVSLGFPILDLRGEEKELTMTCGAGDVTLLPGSTLSFFGNGLHGSVKGLTAGEEIPFALELSLHGSGNISFAPVGVDNSMHLNSPWRDPEFKGAFLPSQQTISPSGFDATWNVSFYGRNFPQQWLASQAATNGLTTDMLNSAWYGVSFLNLVDSYRNVERSMKYAVLFIALVFVTFFLFETMSHLKIHVIQYGLVGAALVLFYLALLSLSEIVSFEMAYISATSASVILITFYCIAIFKSRLSALGLTAGLSSVYGVLYVILQLQDYALLVGTAGLFAALTAVMFVTRKIDWHGTSPSQPIEPPRPTFPSIPANSTAGSS